MDKKASNPLPVVKFTKSADLARCGKSELADISPAEFRNIARRGEWTAPSRMVCYGYLLANLVIVPKEMAFEFLGFCQRNPRPCLVEDVTEPGDPHPKLLAPEADLRTDLPRYRVFRDGKLVDEPTDIIKYWRDDLVAFLIGCSPNFEFLLDRANVQYRTLGGYSSSIPCIPAGRFHGNMAVSCRLFKSSYDIIRAIQISSRLPAGHGPPVHIGNPASIGIDLSRPDILSHPFTQGPPEPDEIALFWGMGTTPGLVAMESKPPLMITHCPGHMFVTDRRIEEMTTL